MRSNQPAKAIAKEPGPVTGPASAAQGVYRWFWGVGLFSAAVNILMLTGAIYMLQVYDRVLVSRSVSTLVALSLLAFLAFAVQGWLDSIRSRMLVEIGAAYEDALSPAVFNTVSALALSGKNSAQAAQPIRDVEKVRMFLSGLGPTALFDLPFMPLFFGACFLLHPLLGAMALGGGVVIILMTVLAEFMSRKATAAGHSLGQERSSVLEAGRRNVEALVAMGFRGAVRDRWLKISADALSSHAESSSRTASLGAFAKTFRLVLQSAMLGLGGYLALNQQITAGAIIAASIMMSRALAPIEIAIGHWKNFVAARESHGRLQKLLTVGDLGRGKTRLPAPQRSLTVERLVVAPPGEQAAIIKGIGFRIEAGSALAIFGPSASGKSTLARALVGVWQAASGNVRLDGAAIEHFPEDQLGSHIGYLPQDVELLEGTVAENIARFHPDATPEEVVAAAVKSGAHEVINRLPNGYDTRIGESGSGLSGGQRQRIALARALFRDPFLVVLDEPNSNLDGNGDQALNDAIASVRSRGGIVIVITHRTATISAVDQIAILNDGRLEEFGPREEVLPKLMRGSGARSAPSTSDAKPAGLQLREQHA